MAPLWIGGSKLAAGKFAREMLDGTAFFRMYDDTKANIAQINRTCDLNARPVRSLPPISRFSEQDADKLLEFRRKAEEQERINAMLSLVPRSLGGTKPDGAEVEGDET